MTVPEGDISVVTPSIPPRGELLARARASVIAQRLLPAKHLVEFDPDRTGSAATRNRALERVETEWTAFLDDDDEFLPHHLRVLRGWAEKSGADVLYSMCELVDGRGQVAPVTPDWAGRPGHTFGPDLLRQRSYIPVTSLTRTSLAKHVGGFGYRDGSPHDDHCFYLRLLDAGAVFLHVPVLTWRWHVHGLNTSGRPDRW